MVLISGSILSCSHRKSHILKMDMQTDCTFINSREAFDISINRCDGGTLQFYNFFFILIKVNTGWRVFHDCWCCHGSRGYCGHLLQSRHVCGHSDCWNSCGLHLDFAPLPCYNYEQPLQISSAYDQSLVHQFRYHIPVSLAITSVILFVSSSRGIFNK